MALLKLFHISVFLLVCTAKAMNPEAEALLRWKSTLVGPGAVYSWSIANSTCSWFGVTCDAAGHVSELNLPNAGLHGTLHAFYSAAFQNLIVLNLNNNNLVGLVPANISLFLTLAVLDLSYNNLVGAIPYQLNHLPMIVEIDLGNNHLSNPEYVNFLLMSSLKLLSLANNNLSGAFPQFITNSTNVGMRLLDLSGNSFSGPLPDSLPEMVPRKEDMAAAPGGPNWLPAFQATRSSIVHVEIFPKGKRKIRRLARTAKSMKRADRKEMVNATSINSTGWVIGFDPDAEEFAILTTAHSVQHVYHGTRAPITAKKINALFRIKVLCDHFENDIREAAGIGERVYGTAKAFGVNCQIDCLLIGVHASEFKRLNGQVCGDPHPVLDLTLVTQDLEDCMLLSWPHMRPRTTCQGFTGQRRRIQDLSKNRAGYDMTVLEAQIDSVPGASGGPLVNLNGEVIGILHASMGGLNSLFIPAAHIQDFLFENGFSRDEDDSADPAHLANHAQ
ncbi:hypothetical protein ZWY2020_014321 [Hordeum vulgare]|nr:hypothetical protein ZWY2020_014321 [Hordeum vulgare]